MRYRAFISYSHADTVAARWLHRKLESFPIDKELAGRETPLGPIPKRLSPIFRDRDDFTAGHSLTAQTLEALDASAALIVVCSPNSAKSHYVNEEIRLFRQRWPERPVIPFIVGGAPNTEAECFPPALRFQIGADGAVTDAPNEVLAADWREAGDGPNLALAKVIARLIGLGTDDVFRRAERARRRSARIRAAVAASIVILAVSGASISYLYQQSQRTIANTDAALVAFCEQHRLKIKEECDRKNVDALLRRAAEAAARGEDSRYDEVLKLVEQGRIVEAAALRLELAKARAKRGAKINKLAAQDFRDTGLLYFPTDTAKALEAYREATDLDPEDAEGWYQFGLLQLRKGESDAAGKSFERVITLANNLQDKFTEAVAIGSLGDVYFMRGDLDAAEPMYEKALVLHEKLNHKDGMAHAYGKLGTIYHVRSNLDAAEAMHNKAFALYAELGRSEAMADAYGNLGLIYETRGDLNAAEVMQKKALTLNVQRGSKEGMAANHGNLGNIYLSRGDFDAAEEMQKKGLALNEQLDRKEGMAANYGNLGLVYQKCGDLEAASAMYERALAIAEELGNKEQQAAITGNLGLMYKTRGDLKAAAAWHEKSLSLSEQLGDKKGMAVSYANLGNIANQRGGKAEACVFWGAARSLFTYAEIKFRVKQVERWMREANCPGG